MSEDLQQKEHVVDIDDNQAVEYLTNELGSIERIEWFKSGYSSRAALVETAGAEKLVARFGNDSLGYKKDKYAFDHFASSKVSIPGVRQLRRLPGGIWLCISEFIDGVKSDELHGDEARAAISSVQETLVAIHGTNIDGIYGYGDLDESGRARYNSWSEYLNDDFCSPEFYQDETVDVETVRHAWSTIRDLAMLCPAERFLVHDDFGSDNLLIKDHRVVAVLDWSSAMIGDWAVDIARTEKYPLEAYGDLKAAHERAGFDVSNWEARMNCYHLRSQIGLVNWVWERQKKGLGSWQSLGDAQAALRDHLKKIDGISD